MIISDLDYLEFLPTTSANYLNGGNAMAITTFSADAYGLSSYTSTVLRNLAINQPKLSFAIGIAHTTALASGNNATATATANALAFGTNATATAIANALAFGTNATATASATATAFGTNANGIASASATATAFG